MLNGCWQGSCAVQSLCETLKSWQEPWIHWFAELEKVESSQNRAGNGDFAKLQANQPKVETVAEAERCKCAILTAALLSRPLLCLLQNDSLALDPSEHLRNGVRTTWMHGLQRS